ncbi:MAG: hypothetical protein AB8F34_05885 [Akkermansiaceae bacterium]
MKSLSNYSLTAPLAIVSGVLFCMVPAKKISAQTIPIPRKSLTGAALGSNIGSGLGGALGGIQKMRQAVGNFNVRISTARKEYFNRYPDKSGFPEAARQFDEILFQKDINILMLMLITDSQKKMFGDSAHTDLVLKLGGGQIKNWDGGIRKNARSSFSRFYKKIASETIDKPQNLLRDPLTLSKAFVAAEQEYRDYLDMRNFGEFRAAERGNDYFKSERSYIQYLLRHNTALGKMDDKGLMEVYGVFVEIFGESALLSGGKKLLGANLAYNALPKDHEAHGLTYGNSMNGADKLVQYLSKDCTAESFLLAHMCTSYDQFGLKVGKLSTEAIMSKYGAVQVTITVNMLRSLAIDPRTDYIASGEYKNMSYRHALRKALPLENDPGIALWQKRKEDRKREHEQAKAEKNRELEAQRMKDVEKNGREQYDAFRWAFAELHTMDMTESKRPYRLYELEVIAGFWNHFVKHGRSNNIRGETYKKFQYFISNLPNQHRKKFRDLLHFLRLDRPQYHGRIKALEIEHLQREPHKRITHNTTAIFRHSPDRYRISHVLRDRARALETRYKMYVSASKSGKLRLNDQIMSLRKEVESLEMRLAKFDQAAGRKPMPSLLKAIDKKNPSLETPPEVKTVRNSIERTEKKAETELPNNDELGAAQLKAFREALIIVRAADQARLKEINTERKDVGLNELPKWNENTELLHLTAGFWSQQDKRNTISALAAINIVDRDTHRKLRKLLDFIMHRGRLEKTATSISVIQEKEIASGSDAENQLLVLIASRDLLNLIRKRNYSNEKVMKQELRLALAKQDQKSKESTLNRIRKSLERAREDQKKLQKQIVDLKVAIQSNQEQGKEAKPAKGGIRERLR